MCKSDTRWTGSRACGEWSGKGRPALPSPAAAVKPGLRDITGDIHIIKNNAKVHTRSEIGLVL